ncbi:Polysaccharide chain length determinant N-terminal domain-containing protein [uncultured Gammaproteobacteria bacterium]
MSDVFPRSLVDDPLSVTEFVRVGLAGWRLVVVSTVFAVVVAAAALRLGPAEYTAQTVLGPTARQGMAAMGGRAPSAWRDVVSIDMVEYGGADETLSDFSRFIQLLISAPVAERLAATPGLVQNLFPERWDGVSATWHTPEGVSGWLRAALFRLAGREDWMVPDPEQIVRHLRRHVVIEGIGTTPMRRLTFRHHDRGFAIEVLSRLVAATDQHLRAEAVRRGKMQIEHLKLRLASEVNVDHRSVLISLLAERERMAMMIEPELPFAADAIEPAGAPRQVDWPNPLLVLSLAAVIGLGLGVMLVYGRSAWTEHCFRRRKVGDR